MKERCNAQFYGHICSESMMCERMVEFLQACTTCMYKLCREIYVMLSESSLIIIEITTMELY